MKKKTNKVIQFLDGLHDFIVTNPQFRINTGGKDEVFIHAELRPVIIRYLEEYFKAQGFKDAVAKANKSFYWEGQEGHFGKARDTLFGNRNYPDFIITDPYLVAIEYKQSPMDPSRNAASVSLSCTRSRVMSISCTTCSTTKAPTSESREAPAAPQKG